jgi:hypothetical protein
MQLYVELVYVYKNISSIRLILDTAFFVLDVKTHFVYKELVFFVRIVFSIGEIPTMLHCDVKRHKFQLFVAETLPNETVLSGFCIPSIQAHSKPCNLTNLILQNWLADLLI